MCEPQRNWAISIRLFLMQIKRPLKACFAFSRFLVKKIEAEINKIESENLKNEIDKLNIKKLEAQVKGSLIELEDPSLQKC